MRSYWLKQRNWIKPIEELKQQLLQDKEFLQKIRESVNIEETSWRGVQQMAEGR